MKLSIVIPAHNEEASITETIEAITSKLNTTSIPYEILVVNDNSKDQTLEVLATLSEKHPALHYVSNSGNNGFGYAIQYGLDRFTGDCVAIMMADLSDSPEDLVNFYNRMLEGNYDCVFGSRFMKGGKHTDYPKFKLIVNRMANLFIRMTMGISYNDTTNAFKLYKRETIQGLKPFLAPHFNLTIELPLKAIIRGYSYTVLPNSWQQRKYGYSKLSLREMGSRYLFILCYCLIEKYFSRGDFKKSPIERPKNKRN